MKIGTFNVDGVNGRLPVLLRWLNETAQRCDGAEEVRLLAEGIIPQLRRLIAAWRERYRPRLQLLSR